MKSELNHSDGTDLLITLLVRFPEAFSVRYEKKQGKLIFTFILKEIIDDSKYKILLSQFKQYMEAYNLLEPINQTLGVFDFFTIDSVSFLTYEQSPQALHMSELKVLTGLIREMFQQTLHAEELPLRSEELKRQEDSIQFFLDKSHSFQEEQNIEAIRDGYQVFVYNK